MPEPRAPAVSIAIPAYNHGPFLGETIQSALAQSWRDYEIIVVDDGSTDTTPQVAAQFEGTIRYLRQANRGMAGARNTAIREARGEFISFLDDDDLWESEYLTTVIPVLQRNPDIAACHTGSQIISGDGTRLPQKATKVVQAERMYETLLDSGFFPPSSVSVRKTWLDRVGLFDEALQGCADWDLWLRISRQGKFVGLPDVLVLYRVHSGGLSSNVEHMLQDHLAAAQKHFGPPAGPAGAWAPAKRQAYSGAHLNAAIAYLQRGDTTLGRDHVHQALCISPERAERLDTFYELALNEQPRGCRGCLPVQDIDRNARALTMLLNSVFSSDCPAAGLRTTKRAAYGNAHLALAMLADQAGNWSAARRYLWRAAWHRPSLFRERSFVRRLAKVSAGRRLTGLLRRPREAAGSRASVGPGEAG